MYGTPIAITSSASTEAGFSCSPPTDANDRSAKMSSVGRAITTSTTPASSRIANSSGMASARPPATSRSPRPLAIATRYTAIAIATAVSQTSGPPEACAVAALHGAGASTGCGRDPVRAGEANVLRRGAGLRALAHASIGERGAQPRHRLQRARLGLDRRPDLIAIPRSGDALVGEQGGWVPGGGERRRQLAAERRLAAD